MSLRSAAHRSRKAAAQTLLRAVALASRDRLVPVDLVRAIRVIAGGADALVASARPTMGQDLADPVLAGHLTGRTLGTWSLGPQSLEFLRGLVMQRRPRLAIEFGSGVSTAVLAIAMRDWNPDLKRPTVVSLEQDEDHAEQTRRFLGHLGIADDVTIIVAPLERQSIEGVATTCYSVPPDFANLLGHRQSDFVLIDGPAGAEGLRFGTLPLVHQSLRDGAWFVLDDALRDGELAIARRWTALPYVEIKGLRLLEKGLLIGQVKR